MLIDRCLGKKWWRIPPSPPPFFHVIFQSLSLEVVSDCVAKVWVLLCSSRTGSYAPNPHVQALNLGILFKEVDIEHDFRFLPVAEVGEHHRLVDFDPRDDAGAAMAPREPFGPLAFQRPRIFEQERERLTLITSRPVRDRVFRRVVLDSRSGP